MAENRNLHVTLQVDANTKAAQAEFNNLQATLKNLSHSAITINTDQMREASQAAEELSIHLQKAFNTNTGQLDLTKFAASIKASGSSLDQYINKIKTLGPEGQQAFQQLATAIANSEAPLIRVNSKLTEFLGTLKNTARWQISSSLLHGFMGSIQSAIQYSKDLNESLTNIQIVTQKSDAEMARFAESANKAAKELSTTTTQYTNASLIYFQQGLNAEEVEKRAKVTTDMAHAAGQSAEETSQQLTAVWNNFYDGSQSLEYYADVMTALGAATASSSAEIAEGLQKFASIGQTVGLSYEYAASALATITATTRESADTVGNALKTLFSRIQGLKLGDTLEDGTDLNKYSAALSKVGINIKDANGNLRDMDKILDDLGARWQQLARDQQTALAQTVAGQRQYAQFMTLMNNWDFMKDNLNIAYDSTGTLSAQADIWEKGWQAASNRVRASLETIYQELANDDFFINLSNVLSTIIDQVGNFINGLGGFEGVLAIIGSVLTEKMGSIAINNINSLIEGFSILTGKAQESAQAMKDSMLQSLKDNGKDQLLAGSGTSLTAYDLELEKLATISAMKAQLAKDADNLTEAEKSTYGIIIQQTEAEYDRQQALAQSLEQMQSLAGEQRESFIDSLASDGSQDVWKDKIEDVEQYGEAIGRINFAQKEALTTLQNIGKDVSFDQAKTKVQEYIEKIESIEGYDLGKPWQDFKQAISSNTGDLDQLRNDIKTLTSDGFTGFASMTQGAQTTEASIRDLQASVANMINNSNLSADQKNFLLKYFGSNQEISEKDALLKALFKNIEDALHRLPAPTVTFTRRLTSGVSSLMSFAGVVRGVSNAIEMFSSGSFNAATAISTLAGTAFQAIRLMRGLQTVFTGLSAVASGGLTLAIMGVAAALGFFQHQSEEAQKQAEEAAKRSKEAAEEAKKVYQENQSEIESNDALIESYEEALKKFEDTKEGKEDLIEIGDQLIEAFEVEGGQVDLLTGHYQGLIDKIKEKRKESLLEAKDDAIVYWSASRKSLKENVPTEGKTEDDYSADKISGGAYGGYQSDLDATLGTIDISDYGTMALNDFKDYTDEQIITSARNLVDLLQSKLNNSPNSIFAQEISDALQDYGTGWDVEHNAEEAAEFISSIVNSYGQDVVEQFPSIIKFGDGSGDGWTRDKNTNNFILDKINALPDEYRGLFTSEGLNNGGLAFLTDLQTDQGIIDTFETLAELVRSIYKDQSDASKEFQQNPLFGNLEAYVNVLKPYYDDAKAAQEAAIDSTLKYYVAIQEGELNQENFSAAVAATAEELGLETSKIEQYCSDTQQYLNLLDPKNVGIFQDKAEISNFDEDEIAEMYDEIKESYGEEGLEIFLDLSLAPYNSKEEVIEAVGLYQEAAKREENKVLIDTQLIASEDALTSFKDNMTSSKLQKWMNDSGIEWDHVFDGYEEPFIKANDFIEASYDERVQMLENYNQHMKELYQKEINDEKAYAATSLENAKTYKTNIEAEMSQAGFSSLEDIKKRKQEEINKREELLKENPNFDTTDIDSTIADLEKLIARETYAIQLYEAAEERNKAAQEAAKKQESLNEAEKQRQFAALNNIEFTALQKLNQDEIDGLTALNKDLIDEYTTTLEDGTVIVTGDIEKFNQAVHDSILEGVKNGEVTALSWKDVVKTFADLEKYEEDIKSSNGGEGIFAALWGQAKSTDTSWKDNVDSITDLMKIIDADKVDTFAEGWALVKENISEMSLDEFTDSLTHLDEKDRISFINENLKKVKITGDESQETWGHLSGIFKVLGLDIDDVKKQTDLTGKSLEEIENLYSHGRITSEDYTKTIKELLNNGSMTTAEAIDAINLGMERGAIQASEADTWLNLVLNNASDKTEDGLEALALWLDNIKYKGEAADKELKAILSNDKTTDRTKLSQIETENTNGNIEDTDAFQEYINFSQNENMSLTDRQHAYDLAQAAYKRLTDGLHDYVLTEDEAILYTEELAKAFDSLNIDKKVDPMKAFTDAINTFGGAENIQHLKDTGNLGALGEELLNIFNSIEGADAQKFEILNQVIESMGFHLSDFKEYGIYAEDFYDTLSHWNTDDLWDFQKVDAYKEHFEDLVERFGPGSDQVKEFASEWLSFIESSDNMTTQDKINALSEALANGAISAPQYLEAMQEVIKTSEDLGFTTDELKSAALDFTINFYDQNGILEDMASSLGKNVESMQELQHIEEELNSRGVDTYEIKRSALIALGEQYDELTDKVEAYKHSLYNENEQVRETAENDLALAVQCKELCDQYDIEYDLVHQLAESYQELGRQGDEFYRACANNTEIAADMAARYIRVNDGIKELEENWEEYEDVIKRMSAVYKQSGNSVESLNSFLYDNSKAVEGIRSAIAKTLAVKNKDIISNKMLAENADLVTEACRGNIKAILELQKVMAKNLSAKLGIDDKEFWATLDGTRETFLDWINNLPEGQLSIDNTLALQKLADMMYEAGMTVDQIEDYFRGMGIEVDFADDFIDEAERLKDTISSAIGAIEEQGTELNNITAEQVETYLQQRELAEGINRDMIQESLDQARNAENEKNNIRSEGANENIRITQEEQNEKNNVEAEGNAQEENIVVDTVNRVRNWVAGKAQDIVDIYRQQAQNVEILTKQQSDAEAENSSKMEPEQMELTDQSEGSYQYAEAHTEDVPFSVTVPAFEASPGYMGFPTFSIHAVRLGGLSYKSIVGKPSNPVKTQDSKTTKMTHPKIIGATKVGGGIGQPSRIVSPGNASGSNRPPASNSGGSGNTGGSAPSPSHIDMPTFQDIHQNDEAVDEHADYDTINRPDEEWHDETYVRRENYKEDKKAEQKEFFQYDATSLVKVDEEIDRYHDINQQLEKIQDNLDEINERKGRAFGQRHLDAINDEKHALQDQLKASQELMEEYQEEAGELTADLLAEGFQIDSEGRIQNYEEGVEAVVSRRNEEQRAILNARNENVARYNQRQQERTDAYNQRSHEITDWTNEGRQQIAQQYDAMVQNEDTIRNNAIQTAYNTRYQEHHTIQDNRANALNALTTEQNQRNQALLASQNEQERAVYEKYYAQIAAHNASIQAQWGDSKNISDDDLRKIVQDNIKAASQAGEDLEAAYKREITDIENATKAAQKALNVEMQEREAAIKADYDEQERLSEERYENAQDQANQRHERQLTIIERQRQEANDIFDIQAENKWRELEDWDELMGEQIDSEYQAQDDILGLEEEASQNRFEKTMSNIERLDSVVSEMGDLANQIQEIKNQIYDSILEGIQYTIELKLRVNDAALKAIQVLIDNVGDSLDKVVDKMALLSRQTRQLGVDANTTFDGIKALIEFRDMETGEVLTDIDSNGIWKKFLNGGLTDSDFKQIKDSDEFTEEQIAALETYRDKLIETLNTIRSVREQEYQLVSDAFDEMINKLDEETNKLEYLTKKAQHYKDVIGIVGRKVLDSTGRLTKQLDQSIFTVAQSTTKANKQTLDTIESNIANLKAQRDQLTDPEEIQRFNDMIAEGEAKRQEAYQKWLDSWKSELEAATTYFQDSIEIIANTFDEKLSGAIGSLDLLSANFDRNRELQDMYVEDYEKIYQLSKLSRDVQNSIDDTEHIKNKAQLKKLMSEINQASEDESKMSQYDLDVLQKKYELEVARLEMEEARNAKSKVRMSRDANGNYGYVYTADENNVAEAEQNYEDKLHEMQVLNTDYIKSLEEQILQTDKDCRDAIANLSMSDFASYEEYEAEVNRIRQHYSSLRDAQLQQMTNATKNNRQLYLEDWTEYSKHTGYKISADENYLDQFNETTYSVLTGFENMTTARQVFQTGLNEMITGALGTYITTSSMYKQALADGDTSIENFGNTVMDTTEDIGTSASTITNDIKTMAQTFQDSFRDMTRELKNFIDEYIKKYKPIIEDMTHLVEGIAGLINYQAFGEASGQGAIVSGVGQNNIDYSVNPAEQQTYTTNTKLAPYIKDVAALLSANIEENTMGWGLAYQAKDKINEVFGQGAYEDIIKYMNKNPQAVQDYWASHWGSDGAFFSSVSYEALRKKYLGFDTGGYTGEWNSNLGRLALLHEKELVLNQNDTENILNTVEMIRDIARTIDINALSASQFMSSMFSAATVADKEQIIQQEVHITAEFPNASDKNEIIDAFDELVNMASQYVNRKA